MREMCCAAPTVPAIDWRPRAAAATASPWATDAALDVLARGGNAIDAAAAAAWVLSVSEQSGSGLGGQTTVLLRLADGRIRVIDGHSRAPRRVSRGRVTRDQQAVGRRACTVPSTPATLDYLVRRFGRLDPADVIRPAARLAFEGFETTPLQARQAAWTASLLRQDAAACRLFLDGGKAPRRGRLQRFPALGNTLERLAVDGVADFYHGRIARVIDADMKRFGGLLDARDLDEFDGPTECEPLAMVRGAFIVWTVPAPGGGATLLDALEASETLRVARIEDKYERQALAVYAAFHARECRSRETAAHGASPVPVAAAVPARGHVGWSGSGSAEYGGDTTHLSVADADGNVVCLTQSIQSLFGAKAANGALGFLYNNYLVTCPRRSHSARLGSRCQARSNVAPCIVTRRVANLPVLAAGAAGSRRIISSLTSVLEAVLDHDRRIDDAIGAPRVHGLLSGKAWVERPAASTARLRRLRARFRRVIVRRPHDYSMGCVQAIQWTSDGRVVAAADPRREGTARCARSEGAWS